MTSKFIVCPCCQGEGTVLTPAMTGQWTDDTLDALNEAFADEYEGRFDDDESPPTKQERAALWETFMQRRYHDPCPACHGDRVLTRAAARKWNDEYEERRSERDTYAYESGCPELLGERVY